VGYGGGRFAARSNQPSSRERPHCTLDRTFREASGVGNFLVAGLNPHATGDAPPEVEIDKKCRWLMVVQDQVRHQRVDNVTIDTDVDRHAVYGNKNYSD
jgi:hypothetical protein